MFLPGQLVRWLRKPLDAKSHCIYAVVEAVEAERVIVRFAGPDGDYWRRADPKRLFVIPDGVEVDEMKISKLFPSKFVKATDLNGKTPTLTMLKVKEEKMGHGNDAEIKPVLYFKNATKGLVLNRTNGVAIANLYGDETDGWEGKRITLYATTIRAFGKLQDVIRIKEEIPAQPKPVTQSTEPEEASELDDAEDVVDHEDADQ